MGNNEFDPGKPRIMAHVVAGYPDREASLAAAMALADAGAAYLEVQFPFSDPSADGPVIQTACVRSLAAGFTMSQGFGLVRQLTEKAGVPVFIMSYASPVAIRGSAAFCDSARQAGAAGLIVPDLTLDEDEGLYAEGASRGLAVIPVIAPGMRGKRLDRIVSQKTEFIYTALRTGITGKESEIGGRNLSFIEKAKAGGAKVMAGFGVKTRAQILALAPHIHAAIVGTAFTETIAMAAASAKAPGPTADLIAKALRERFRSFKEG
jgi:tryptophan synthase alpha chain